MTLIVAIPKKGHLILEKLHVGRYFEKLLDSDKDEREVPRHPLGRSLYPFHVCTALRVAGLAGQWFCSQASLPEESQTPSGLSSGRGSRFGPVTGAQA